MQSIRQIEKLNAGELAAVVPPSASWHTDYRDSAYVYIGGLAFALSEGDVLAIFSQYGNPVHIHLVRDKETGKSRGFCFLKYEDQRSCDLAVDNLSGAVVLGRTLSVDHARYERKDGEVEGEGLEEEGDDDDDDGVEARRGGDESGSEDEERPLLREEMELAKLLREHDVEDPMKAYLVKEKKEEVRLALQDLNVKEKSRERHHRRRSRRDEKGDEEDRARHHKSRRHRLDGPEKDERGSERHRSRPDRGSRDAERDDRNHSSRARTHDQDDRSGHKSKRELRHSPVSSGDEGRHRRRTKRDDHRDYDDDNDEKGSTRRYKSHTRSRSPYRRR
nr:u2 snrnp component ist3 [Quercus suber]